MCDSIHEGLTKGGRRILIQPNTVQAHDTHRVPSIPIDEGSDRQKAGLGLEGLLTRLFALFDLEPNGAFRVTGEQIDGSFDLNREVYLLEAKWTLEKTEEGELLKFRGKIEGKSQFTRGLFLSINGYSAPAVEAITRGKSPNFVMLDGAHLFRVLAGQVRLEALLRRLVRHLSETGAPYLPASEF